MNKKYIKKLLKQFNCFYQVKYSKLFTFYQLLFQPEILERKKRDEEFFRSLFSTKPRLIFDVGANHGDKTLLFSKMANKVIALDPDQTNYEILQVRFGKNKKVEIVQKAVDRTEGTSNLFIVEDGSGLNTMSRKWVDVLEDSMQSRWKYAMNFEKKVIIKTTTLSELVRIYGKPDYIKIDVEGYELNVISGLSEKIPLLSFECNLPEFYEETMACIKLLHAIDVNAKFNYFDESKWGFGEFLYYDEFYSWYLTNEKRYFEIFCKMTL